MTQVLDINPALERQEYKAYEKHKMPNAEQFCKRLRKRNDNLLFVHCSLAEDVFQYHTGYLEYLEYCWSKHRGIIISPDIIWNIILSELAQAVIGDAEHYRNLFTDSDEKKRIIVQYDNPYDIPLDKVYAELEHLVPTDTEVFQPEFTTTTETAKFCNRAAFAEMCSPYYDYCTFCCGFPRISVRGEQDDYKKISERFNKIAGLENFATGKEGPWIARAKKTLEDLADNYGSKFFFENMCFFERCGSGSELEAAGWITKLFREEPSLRKVANFTAGMNEVRWTNLSLDMKMIMKSGLLYSTDEGDFAVPQWGHVVFHDNTPSED